MYIIYMYQRTRKKQDIKACFGMLAAGSHRYSVGNHETPHFACHYESALIFGVTLHGEETVAQTANELVGTWTLVSLINEQGGIRTDLFGPNPERHPDV